MQFGAAFHECESVLTITTTISSAIDIDESLIATQDDYHNEIVRCIEMIEPKIHPDSYHCQIGIQGAGCILSQCERIGFDDPITACEVRNSLQKYGKFAFRIHQHHSLKIQTVVEHKSMFVICEIYIP